MTSVKVRYPHTMTPSNASRSGSTRTWAGDRPHACRSAPRAPGPGAASRPAPAERREELLETVLGHHDRHAVLASARRALAHPARRCSPSLSVSTSTCPVARRHAARSGAIAGNGSVKSSISSPTASSASLSWRAKTIAVVIVRPLRSSRSGTACAPVPAGSASRTTCRVSVATTIAVLGDPASRIRARRSRATAACTGSGPGLYGTRACGRRAPARRQSLFSDGPVTPTRRCSRSRRSRSS